MELQTSAKSVCVLLQHKRLLWW